MAAAATAAERICTHYLLSAPPGQAAEVERDVCALAAPGALSADALAQAWRKYNARTCAALRLSSDRVFLCTEEGTLDEAHAAYSDATGVHIALVSHREQTAAPVDTADPAVAAAAAALAEPELEPLRSAAYSALARHVARSYNPAGAGTTPWARGCEVFARGRSLLLSTAVVVKNSDRAFWSGGLSGRWELQLGAPGTAEAPVLAGRVSIATHYFEAGNTQLHDARTFRMPLTLPAGVAAASDAAAVAAAVVRAIAACEDELSAALDGVYERLSGAVLKEMRRFLPLGGAKFDWANWRGRRALQALGAGGAAPAAAGKGAGAAVGGGGSA